MTGFILAVIGYALFTVIGIAWLFHRLGDYGKDRWWWVRALDWVLLTPLVPYFLLFNR